MKSTDVAPDREVIAIVGSGFSGTMVAVNLARLAEAEGNPVHVVLFERGERFARGVAYGTSCPEHLLNVPAGMMSALADDPGHFLEWLRTQDPQAQASTFAPRRLYGDYLEAMLTEALGRDRATIELVRDEVVDLCPEHDGSGITLIGRAGTRVKADRVVLALGNPSPHDVVTCPAGLKQSGKYVGNSWDHGPLEGVGPSDSIALIGTGLSAVDVIMEAKARGFGGPLAVISRHGLLPLPHRPAGTAPGLPPLVGGTIVTARSMLRHLRELAARCAQEGADWRPAIDGLRPVIQGVWRSFSLPEKRRFIRHLGSFWDVHRHRIAPDVARALDDLRDEGRLTVIAGRIQAIAEQGDQVEVTFLRRGRANAETLLSHRVINCTGPTRTIEAGRSPLIDALIERNAGRPDPLALGLEVADTGALIDADGESSGLIYALGPILKGQLWETTAVRELRSQALDLARHLTALATRSRLFPLEDGARRADHRDGLSLTKKRA